MKSLYNFIVKPYGERYNNKIDVDGNELIINSGIEDHKFVNRIAQVVETPINFNSNINKGDLVLSLIHI